jgi:hypothetical protein
MSTTGDNITSTIVYTTKTYKTCGGTAWHGSGQCSTCGAQIGTGGNCMAAIEVVPEPIEEVCTLCGRGGQ